MLENALALSEPVAREEFHTRRLEIKGYRRSDGLWDIEGHLTDSRPFAHEGRAAGEPIHDLWVRLTIDAAFLVHKAEAFTERGPYDACPLTNAGFAALAGLRIGPGWNRQARERVGGRTGCTHLYEMLGQMATAAMQTLWGAEEGEIRRRPDGRPSVVDTCYAWRADGPVVQRSYPEHYTGS
jgi:hypothetical protein